MFLICKEALNNALKYSKATKIDITLKKKNENIILYVHDNGKGFVLTDTTNGNGLKNMKTRAKNIGGFCQIDSIKGKGTKIHVEVPIT